MVSDVISKTPVYTVGLVGESVTIIGAPPSGAILKNGANASGSLSVTVAVTKPGA
jgi:hypothetical protein